MFGIIRKELPSGIIRKELRERCSGEVPTAAQSRRASYNPESTAHINHHFVDRFVATTSTPSDRIRQAAGC